MSFHETRFPEDISYGSSGGPRFRTLVMVLDSGFEQRNISWAKVRAEYNVGQAIKTPAQMDALISFFYARRGRAYGFRYKDWADFSATNQQIGVGDASNTQYQMVKTYISGSESYGRNLYKIVSGTVPTINVNGSPASFTLNYNTGLVTMTSPPASGHTIVVPSLQFDVPVRFDTDQLDIKQEYFQTQSWDAIPLVEVRL